ncbi:MAG: hypothetical protein ABRQ27_14710 [Clostridiaceae bacterium]
MNIKKIFINLIITVLAVSAVLALIYRKLPQYERQKTPTDHQEELENILCYDETIQGFVSSKDNLFGVELNAASVSSNPGSSFFIYILDSNKTIIQKKIVDMENITDNSMIKIDFDIQKKSEGQQYYILFRPNEVTEDDAVHFAARESNSGSDRPLVTDGKRNSKEMLVNAYYMSSKTEVIKNSLENMPVDYVPAIVIFILLICSLGILMFIS